VPIAKEGNHIGGAKLTDVTRRKGQVVATEEESAQVSQLAQR